MLADGIRTKLVTDGVLLLRRACAGVTATNSRTLGTVEMQRTSGIPSAGHRIAGIRVQQGHFAGFTEL